MPGSDTYFLEVGAHDSLKVATKDLFKDRKLLKFYVFKAFFVQENGRMELKRLKSLA